MSMAYYLSRIVSDVGQMRTTSTGAMNATTHLANTFWDIPTFIKEQQEDEDIAVMVRILGEHGGRWSRVHRYGDKETWVPVVPATLQVQALRLVHDAPLSGHMGQNCTWERARNSFWWPGLKNDVAHISKYEARGENERAQVPGKASLQYMEIPDYTNYLVQVDRFLFLSSINSDLNNAEVAGRLVREKLGRFEKTLRLVKERVAVAQGRRKKKYYGRLGAAQIITS
ncbi:putative Transposon Ty3-G Gag-Pol polyprotein-like 2 [Homarus americanus]|uniref:Putative Transposon Ty3-G Gag-Pol polyprotein-like 2 n=1 Tax=Homarus americanus TaxID=6706 RepID=A0A8J5JZ41_HOMAM|nr:putative Transposon Ty3-G Gag-Pol polyprotein-like 2 [Homarus americanus]